MTKIKEFLQRLWVLTDKDLIEWDEHEKGVFHTILVESDVILVLCSDCKHQCLVLSHGEGSENKVQLHRGIDINEESFDSLVRLVKHKHILFTNEVVQRAVGEVDQLWERTNTKE